MKPVAPCDENAPCGPCGCTPDRCRCPTSAECTVAARRPRVAHFRLEGDFDGVDGATVTIDTRLGLFTVRPLRRRRAYELPFVAVAQGALFRVMKAEAKLARKAKARR